MSQDDGPVSQAVSTAARTLRIISSVTGIALLAAFALGGHPPALVLPLSIFAFLAGGVSLSLCSSDTKRQTSIGPSLVIGYGAGIVLGPVASAVPAAMVALGGILLVPSRRLALRGSIYEVTRLPFQAALAGGVFTLFGGTSSQPFSVTSIPAVFGAAAAYGLIDRLLASEPDGVCNVLLSLGGGFCLAAWVAAMPAFAVLIPALPLAIVLLAQVKLPARQKLVIERMLEEQERPSVIDPISGLANQRYLEMFMQQEIGRSERSGQPMTVLLVDIDNFKELRTGDGEAEDLCIAALGVGLKEMLRDYDLVARYKDDEFVIVLPETDSVAGYETAQRLHSELSGKVMPARVKFSVGVATFPTHGATIDDLMSSAHHALNRAKFSGKNTVRSCHQLAKAS